MRFPLSCRSVYSCFVDLETGTFVSCDTLVPSTQSLISKDANVLFGEMFGMSSVKDKMTVMEELVTDLIPTVDTVRFSFLCALLLANKHPVLLTGLSLHC